MNRSSPPLKRRSYGDGTDQTEAVEYRTEDAGPRIFSYDGKSNRRSLWGDFEFTRCLHDAPVLVALITLRLRREPELEEDDDGLDASVGTDTRKHIYTYRTRTSRALALLPTFLAVISLIPFFIPLMIAHIEQLKAEITLQAVHSGTHGWQAPPRAAAISRREPGE